ncbi:MAG: glycosyltransferase [Ktedonobacterales bacterium]|nr:glycosyltransferase [Ktedonobacterales bacterium]
MSAPLPAISVIIPTYNRRESLRATLQGLAAQTVPAGTFEALVISDGATDGTAALCATLSAAPDLSYSLRYFEQDHQGPSAARNLGMRQARAPLLLFLDDDVVPDPTLVGEHLRLLREQPGAVVIGPLLLPPGVRLQPWVRWESERLLTQYAHMRRGLWEPTPSQFYTGNASLARAAALTVGGFDVTFPRAEDVELAYRLRDHGLRFIFAPDARGWHYAQRSFRSWLRTPWLYGEADAAMSLRQGRNEILERMCSGYWERRRVIRGLARLCVGRWPLRVGVVGVGGALANVAGALPGDAGYSLASAALSVIFNLSYWQSLAKHIGRRHFWDLIYGRAHPVPAPLLAGKAPTTR